MYVCVRVCVKKEGSAIDSKVPTMFKCDFRESLTPRRFSQPYSIHLILLQYKVWIICRTRFKTRNSCDAAGTSQTTNFFTLRVKNTYVYALNNLNSHFYSNDSKNFHTTQTTIFLIQIMLETYNEDTMQTTNFLILAERFKHTIYILQRQESVPRLNMENFMAQYTNETT